MKKKLLATLLASILLLSITIPASASNTDTSFKFSFGVSGGQNMNLYTTRAKENATSSYVHYKAGKGSLCIRMYGSTVKGVIKRNDRGGYSNVVECTYPYDMPVLKIGTRGFVRQLIYEKGFPYAALGAMGRSEVYTCSGVWSPDSVPEAGVKTLN